MKKAVIVAAARTPVGAFGGSLSSIPAPELGATVIKSLLAKTKLTGDAIDEVILGQVLTAGSGQNPARQASIKAGLPVSVPAMTINKVCGSGLKSIHLAAQAIACGDADVVIAGGQENMSAAPHVLPNSRNGQRMGEWKMQDSMITDGLWDAFNDYHMGCTAENLADKYNVSREAQDEFAAQSQNKAEAAQSAGYFDEEIVPVSIPQRRGDAIVVDKDEYIKPGSTSEKLGKLRAAFKKDGSVTAGNASGINDGAAAVIVMSSQKAAELNLPVLAEISGYASAGVEPSIMGIGPVPAVKKCLAKADWELSDIDLIEANEAFAAQALSVGSELQWNAEKVNVNGGAIAIGHPIGASGTRILVTLLHEMKRRDVSKGLATLCIGGGQGVALAVAR